MCKPLPLISFTHPFLVCVCVVYKSQTPGICPEKDLDKNGVWVRALILFSSMLLQAMAVLMQWQGSLKLWLYETKANFLSFVHYRERLPAGRKACCANYSIHESSLKYVMDFTGLFTGKQGDVANTHLSTCWLWVIIPVNFFFFLKSSQHKDEQIFKYTTYCT